MAFKALNQHIEASEKNIFLKGFDDASKEGFTQIPNSILRNPDLSMGAKMTYSILLSYAWYNSSCFPGQKKASEHLGISERYLRKFLTELKDKNLLTIKRRGLGKTNYYYLYSKVPKKVWYRPEL